MNIRNRQTLTATLLLLTTMLMLGPLGLLAREDAEPTGKPSATQPKLAIELGAPF